MKIDAAGFKAHDDESDKRWIDENSRAEMETLELKY